MKILWTSKLSPEVFHEGGVSGGVLVSGVVPDACVAGHIEPACLCVRGHLNGGLYLGLWPGVSTLGICPGVSTQESVCTRVFWMGVSGQGFVSSLAFYPHGCVGGGCLPMGVSPGMFLSSIHNDLWRMVLRLYNRYYINFSIVNIMFLHLLKLGLTKKKHFINFHHFISFPLLINHFVIHIILTNFVHIHTWYR